MYVQKNLKRRQTFANCFRFFSFPDGSGDPSPTVPSFGAGKSK